MATTLPRNSDVADQLDLLADLSEIRGDDSFRVGAYRRAATRVRETSAPVAELAVSGRAKELQGIGKTIEEKIVQIVQDGEIHALTKRKAEIPDEVVLFMRLPGLGPKSARKIWKELGITTIDSCARRPRDSGCARSPGMGAKTEENVLTALAAPAAVEEPRRTLLGRALPALEAVVSVLAEHPAVRAGLDCGERAALQGDRPRPRHHRDRERRGRADRVLHDASLGPRHRREGADQGDGRLARRLPLRPARRATRVLRQPAPALHRLEGPQRRAPRGRRPTEALGVGVRRGEHRDGRDVHGAHRGGAVPAPRLRVDPSRAARELRRARGARKGELPELVGSATSAAISTRTRTGRRREELLEEMVASRDCARAYEYYAITDHSHYLREGRLAAQAEAGVAGHGHLDRCPSRSRKSSAKRLRLGDVAVSAI